MGFGPAGIAAGSIAAGWQAASGSIAAGSLFATLQSLGMTAGAAQLGVGMGALATLGVAVVDST
ncbi:hypothetical protein FRC11_008197 [Ceratobasidium sp. 423]|nr:hypothetical protein FRC11_008197 [Ceratobasidium sp. 423]